MRIAIAFLTAALLGSMALSAAGAQEAPGPLSPPNKPVSGTGSISGTIIAKGFPDFRFTFPILIVSADAPQPVLPSQVLQSVVEADEQSNFTFEGLVDGEYLIGIFTSPDLVPDLQEKIRVGPPVNTSYPAIRVRITNGQAVTGLEIMIQPAPTPSLPPPGAPGTISGRVVVAGAPNIVESFQLCVVPAAASQPLSRNETLQRCRINTNTHGEFIVYSLAEGDYLIGLLNKEWEVITPLPERLSFQPAQGSVRTLSALRVTLPSDRGVTGVEIVLRLPSEPVLAPSAGAAPHGDTDGSARYIGAAVAGLAALLLAGGVALRVRANRPR